MAAPLSDTQTRQHPFCPGVWVGPAVAAAGADVSGAANDLEQDRLLLRTFNEYCKANKQARALEVAQELHLVQCLEGESSCWAGGLWSLCSKHAGAGRVLLLLKESWTQLLAAVVGFRQG